MTSDGAASDDGSDFVRPSLTIRERHDQLLDELHQARYGSRSEAVRAAIESLAQSVLSNGETGIERTSKQVEQLSTQIDELVDQIDELQKHPPGDRATNSASQHKNDSGSAPDVPAVEGVESRGSAELQNMIYTLLLEEGSMSVSEIAEYVGEEPLEVHQSLTILVEEYDFLTCADYTEPPRYEIKDPSSN